jgi:hypothetical protein
MIDPSYYANTQFGYCVPDGLTLTINGLPEDNITQRFTLSIYNKLGTPTGNQQLKQFMQIYLPKFHFSNPSLDFDTHKLVYYITSMTFDAFNVTQPASQNISLCKMNVLFDDQIAFTPNPYTISTYGYFPFQAGQTYFYDYANTNISYNLSFANSYLVESYTVQADKFY